jgi:hypothetical protein
LATPRAQQHGLLFDVWRVSKANRRLERVECLGAWLALHVSPNQAQSMFSQADSLAKLREQTHFFSIALFIAIEYECFAAVGGCA